MHEVSKGFIRPKSWRSGVGRAVLGMKSNLIFLALFAVWGMAIWFTIESFRTTEQWNQTVQMGFSQPEEWVIQQASAGSEQHSVQIWQGLSQRLIEEDFSILTETWMALDQSKTVSNEFIENLGSVIRRTLFRMCSQIDMCMETKTSIMQKQRECSSNQCCMEFKLCWPSPLSQYLVHFQKEVQSRNLFQGSYRESRDNWVKAGDDFCCKINELALIWRDLDHRILSQDRVFNTEFRDRVDQKLEDLAQKSSHYFKHLNGFIDEMERLSVSHKQSLKLRSTGYLLGLFFLAPLTYLVFIFSLVRPVSVERQEPAELSISGAVRKTQRSDFSNFEGMKLETLPDRDASKVLQSMAGWNCLIIEDDVEGRQFLQEMLEDFQLQCSAIDSNIDLSVERLESYDLIVSDVALGPDNINGIEFTRTMREKGCTIPVLLVSAHFPADAMKWEQPDSVTLGIRKPLECSLLVAGLAKLFELHGENGPLEFS